MNRLFLRRYWVELATGVLAFVLLIATLISREWIELVFRVDPDGGNGALEWGLVLALGAIVVLRAWQLRRGWIATRAAAGT